MTVAQSMQWAFEVFKRDTLRVKLQPFSKVLGQMPPKPNIWTNVLHPAPIQCWAPYFITFGA
jgi:hypothetical protein